MLIVYRLLASLCASAWFRRKYTVVIFMLLNISKPVLSLSVRVFLRNIVRVYWGIQILKGNLCSLSNSNFIHHRTFTADYSPSLWVHRFCKTKVANMRRSKKGLSYLALWCFGIQSNPNPYAFNKNQLSQACSYNERQVQDAHLCPWAPLRSFEPRW